MQVLPGLASGAAASPRCHKIVNVSNELRAFAEGSVSMRNWRGFGLLRRTVAVKDHPGQYRYINGKR
jgi:hypothetical protein